jgi:hypothetical protein
LNSSIPAPQAAVPDDLLDAHAAREGVREAGAVRREQHVDQRAAGGAVGGNADVEVPVDGAVLGVQRRLVRPPLLAAVRPPVGAADVAAEPADERDHAGPHRGRAVRRRVVVLQVGGEVGEAVGRVARDRGGRSAEPERAGGRGRGEQARGDEDGDEKALDRGGHRAGDRRGRARP